ncbi:hypothetical protein AB0N16_25675 [Streptomyces sp. NPDC051105]|uniref:hypothetical protein n=1 Tax=Streptomyces sp. NPDC051105 TaxID=3154843 RepID=UPI00342CB933
MTGPGGPGGPGEPRHRVTARPREWALATHKPCPVDGCPGPARVPMRSTAHPSALDHGEPGDPGDDTAPCRRCGTGPRAYANAPELRREMHRLLALGAERDGRRAGPVTGPPVDARAAERAWLLRRAALMDRMALGGGSGPAAAAAETAEQLVRYDRRHPDLVAGPYHPDAITLARRRLRYVRQEYAAWTAAGCPGS